MRPSCAADSLPKASALEHSSRLVAKNNSHPHSMAKKKTPLQPKPYRLFKLWTVCETVFFVRTQTCAHPGTSTAPLFYQKCSVHTTVTMESPVQHTPNQKIMENPAVRPGSGVELSKSKVLASEKCMDIHGWHGSQWCPAVHPFRYDIFIHFLGEAKPSTPGWWLSWWPRTRAVGMVQWQVPRALPAASNLNDVPRATSRLVAWLVAWSLVARPWPNCESEKIQKNPPEVCSANPKPFHLILFRLGKRCILGTVPGPSPW